MLHHHSKCSSMVRDAEHRWEVDLVPWGQVPLNILQAFPPLMTSAAEKWDSY